MKLSKATTWSLFTGITIPILARPNGIVANMPARITDFTQPLIGVHRVITIASVAAIMEIAIPCKGAQLVAQFHKNVPWLNSRNMIILLNLSVSGIGLCFRTKVRLEEIYA